MIDLPTLPHYSPGPQEGVAGEGKHKFIVERIPERDVLLVSRDRGPIQEIPMKLIAQGRTIAEIYEELSNA